MIFMQSSIEKVAISPAEEEEEEDAKSSELHEDADDDHDDDDDDEKRRRRNDLNPISLHGREYNSKQHCIIY